MDELERRVVAALWSLPGVGIRSIEAIRGMFPQLGELLERPAAAWVDLAGELPGSARQALQSLECLAAAADRLDDDLRYLDYRMIFQGEPAYPPLLLELREAPPVLFMLGPGAAGPPRRRVALVGTRRPDTGALEPVRALAEDLSAQGIGIISGAAEGIDRVAHLGALDGGGETWAFLGCAIEQMDPAQAVLIERFAEGAGTFFSQFPPGTRPEPGTFVQRNRWISGSADAVIVARAPHKSGALITARNAREQGRPVLAVPGDPWLSTTQGSNDLLTQGARPCRGVADVRQALGLGDVLSPEAVAAPPLAADLSPEAEQVLAVVTRAPTAFDELLQLLGTMDPGAATAALLELELAGQVLQKPGKRYERVS